MAALLSKIYNPEIASNLPPEAQQRYVQFFSDEEKRFQEYRMALNEYATISRMLHGESGKPSQIQFYKARVEFQKMAEYWDRRVKGIERAFPEHIIAEWKKRQWTAPQEASK
jgi:hypothetical protein